MRVLLKLKNFRRLPSPMPLRVGLVALLVFFILTAKASPKLMVYPVTQLGHAYTESTSQLLIYTLCE
jgi:hypothetical protein